MGEKLTDEPDEYGWDDDDQGEDEDDEGWDECGMMPDGFCTLAGSEWCDWHCPRNKPATPAGRAALSDKGRG